MRFTTIICGGILSGVTGVGLACDLPTLAVIPPKDEVVGKEVEIRAAAAVYFQGMQAYTACVQAELAAAGGDSAPTLVKRVLAARNNTAVAEAELMISIFTDNVGPIEPAAGAPPAPAN